MSVRGWIPRLAVSAIVASLISLSAGAQAPNFYSSVIVTDILSGSPIVGGTFTTDIQVSVVNNASPQIGIEGVEIWLPFNASIVTVDDYDDNPANGVQVEIRRGFFDGNLLVGANDAYVGQVDDPTTPFERIPDNAPPECTPSTRASENNGCIHVGVSHTGGSGPVINRSGSVATVTWGGIAIGNPDFSVSLDPALGSKLVDSNGSPQIIHSLVVPQISIFGGGGIRGVALMQGIGSGGYAGTTVSGFSPTGEWAETQTATDGTFFLSPLTASSITVHATHPGYLRSQKGSIYLAGGEVDIGTTTLVGGDVNSDNCINILDVVSIIFWFGQNSPPAPDAVDINNSGSVNIQDLTLAAGNFTRCGPTTWRTQ